MTAENAVLGGGDVVEQGEPSRRARLWGRTAVVALLVLFAGQQVVTKVWREPYPAIAQPSFSGSTHELLKIDSQQPAVVATFADGSTRTFDSGQIMGQSPESPIITYRASLGAGAPHRDDPSVVAWLGRRLSQLAGGERAVSAVLQERTVTHYLDDPSRDSVEVTASHPVTFGSTGA